jgi:uncharacterized protein YbcI
VSTHEQARPDGRPLTGGELNSAIANAAVRIHRLHLGRGPSKGHAFFRHNVVVILFEDAMTREERALVAGGHLETASRMRRELHDTMRADLTESVEALTGCGVVACMSDASFEPDITVNVFVLDRWISGQQPPAAGSPGPVQA